MSPANLPPALALIKSSGDPLLDLAGAYFPAWLACMVVGVLGAWLVGEVFARFGVAEVLRPSVLMYPALFALISCAVWLVFFSAA